MPASDSFLLITGFRHQMDAPVKKSAFQRNLQALVAQEEPDPRLQAAHLGARLNRSRVTGWRLLDRGTNLISVAQEVADAYDMPLVAILDEGMDGATRLDGVQVPIGGHVLALTVWVEPHPEIPWCRDVTVVRLIDGAYWLGVFGDGPCEPCYLVRWIEGVGEPLPRKQCNVVVCATDRIYARSVADGLAAHGFSVTTSSCEQLPQQLSPDVLIVRGYDEKFVAATRIAIGRTIPAITVTDTERAHDPASGLFYVGMAHQSILMMLRQIVRFSRP